MAGQQNRLSVQPNELCVVAPMMNADRDVEMDEPLYSCGDNIRAFNLTCLLD